jgi:meiotically up-regulated gene 157 (Mug157) protein
MDDANVPSLLSLPFLEFIDKNDPIYQNTRKAILSLDSNPYFFKGVAGEGVGGPHVGDSYIWPMSIIIRAFTTDDDKEIMDCLQILQDTTCDTGNIFSFFFFLF